MLQQRPPYGAAAAVGLAVLGIYTLTLAPTTAFWDTSEYIATAHILGIPHPPGNPLFLVVARAWSVLLAPLGLPVAVRINLLAATTSAASAGFLFLVAQRILSHHLGGGWQAGVGAAAAALLGATAFTVWNQSNVNEKVYTLSVLVIAAVTWLATLWRDRRHLPGSERYLLVALFLMVLGTTNHLMSILPAPALLVLVALSDFRAPLRPAFLLRAVPLVLLGLSLNFFLPIRAADDPVINEGDPTCESMTGAAVAIYSNGTWGCPALADNLSRKQYQKPDFLRERMAPLKSQLLNYYQYFDWQWSRGLDASELPGTARTPFTLFFLALGLTGLYAAFRADRALGAYLAVLALTLSVALVYYLNFKYGYSLSPEITGPNTHEVRERDYFFIGSFVLWGMLSGVGLAWAWGAVASVVRHPRRALLTSPLLTAAFIPLVLNWSWATRAGDYAARDWAFDLLQSVEPYGVLFTNGDNDTFPLWYLQEVEGIRQDVTVIVGEYLNTTWYVKQLQELTRPDRQRHFDPSSAPGLYDEPAAPPSDAVIAMPQEWMDRVTFAELGEDFTLPLPGLNVTYPAGTRLTRLQQLALSIIHDAGAERPIYFASSGGLMAQLGLRPWAIRYGLTSKLVLRGEDQALPEGVVRGTPEYGGEAYHVERSLRLYQEVYRYRGIRDRPIWQDRSTLNVPYYYYVFTIQLADVGRVAGLDEGLVESLEADAQGFQMVADGGVAGTPRR
jgi:hypothetical protein